VLTDVVAELPEVVRLGWSLSQLQCEIPIFGERVPGHQLPRVASLAMVSPALAAAEVVQLARFDEPAIQAALVHWRLADAEHSAALAEILSTWWATYTSSKPHWSIALAALHQMLPDEAAVRSA
jgi:hypothetical protein